MLYHEAACLIKMAEQLDQYDSLTLLHEQAARLRESVESAWQPRTGLYRYRDRETGLSLAGKVLVSQKGAGTVTPKLTFEQPVRLLIQVQTQDPAAKRPEIRIYQVANKSADEVILSGDYQWRNGGSVYTTKTVFSKLAKVVVRDLAAEDVVTIKTLDFTTEDHTLFVPLWADVPDAHHAQVMIGRALLDANRFYRPYGVPACPLLASQSPEAESIAQSVHLPWNLLICEGLLRHGFQSDAARLFVHNMTAVIQNLKQDRAFHARYHAERGTGIGERNPLYGLAAVGLFMKILGVQILSATRVKIERENLFPWDVTIEYKDISFTEDLKFDLLVEGCLLIEVKSVQEIHPVHKAQLLSYMKLLNIPLGLIINFHELKLTDGVVRLILPGANR